MNASTRTAAAAVVLALFLAAAPPTPAAGEPAAGGRPDGDTPATPAQVLDGLKRFYQRTALPDGSFQPGIDPDYQGMSDSAYSDLAPVTYAVMIHKTFGWKLPARREDRRVPAGAAEGGRRRSSTSPAPSTPSPPRAAPTTRRRAWSPCTPSGVKPKHDPLPVFEDDPEGGLQAPPAVLDELLPAGVPVRRPGRSRRRPTAASAA